MKPDVLSSRYRGKVARRYDVVRMSGNKWRREQQIVCEMLRALPPGSTVIDVPIGTGRFVETYKKCGLRTTGVDVSVDMLTEAKEKAARSESDISLEVGDIRRLEANDHAFDYAVCIRFLNWIDTKEVEGVLRELSRVCKRGLIIGIRYYVQIGRLMPPYRFGRLMNVAGQVLRCLGYRRGLVIHEERDVIRIFRDLGLKILQSEGVEQRWDGTSYDIYRLGKATDEASR